MRASYVVADLVRNPRRTLSTMVGVVLGVGLFCGVLFFVDGLSASMTQRAAAPLSVDMQRIVAQRAAVGLTLAQTFSKPAVDADGRVMVTLELHNESPTAAHEVTVRSVPGAGVRFVSGSARIDGAAPPEDDGGNPFAQGPAQAGTNLGTMAPGDSRMITYVVAVGDSIDPDHPPVESTFSTRESVSPISANAGGAVELAQLAEEIAGLPGVATAAPLSIADLEAGSIATAISPTGTSSTGTSSTGTSSTGTSSTGTSSTEGPAKIFGFDRGYADRNNEIVLAAGSFTDDGAVVSAEVSNVLGIGVGDQVTVELPDGSRLELMVSGVADLSRARALFSSRRGGDLETFIYRPNAVVVSPGVFADEVFPAYERAAAGGNGRLKSPPIREVDIGVDHELLDADPATAVAQTEQIAVAVLATADQQDYLLDNISNTLRVAAADATVAKQLFVFLGVPGALLAAILAAYAGNVMAESQRREQAILRIRGANRHDLLVMHTVRTAVLTASGSALGLAAGYGAASVILGQTSLGRASAASIAVSASVGTLTGFAATGAALYLTGRRSIDREINEDRRQLTDRPPLWRRTRLDVAGLLIVAAGTVWALGTDAFAGTAGSVYYGRGTELRLRLLLLPLAVWVTGSLVAARLIGGGLQRSRPPSNPRFGSMVPALVRRSVGRRPWAVTNAGFVAALIVALTTSLGGFTAAYDAAKEADARYATGADIRITPSPTADRVYTAEDPDVLRTESMSEITPVIYGLNNVILRSDRTSDPANLAAVDPATYAEVAPLEAGAADLTHLVSDENSVMLSEEMARYLKVELGDTVHILLERSTARQTEREFTIVGFHTRLPGFPEGADAVIDIAVHTEAVPTKAPDFFLAATTDPDDTALSQAVNELLNGPAAADHLQIDSRATTLDRDQSSLAALNIAGLIDIDSVFALGMAAVVVAIFVFGLMLHRRREYVVLRAQGVEPPTIRLLIGAEAALVAILGSVVGVAVGAAMGSYFVSVLRPLFVLDPSFRLPITVAARPIALIVAATVLTATAGSHLVNSLEPTELLRDE